MLPSRSVPRSPKTKRPQPEFRWQIGGWLIRQNGIHLCFSCGCTEPKGAKMCLFPQNKQLSQSDTWGSSLQEEDLWCSRHSTACLLGRCLPSVPRHAPTGDQGRFAGARGPWEQTGPLPAPLRDSPAIVTESIVREKVFGSACGFENNSSKFGLTWHKATRINRVAMTCGRHVLPVALRWTCPRRPRHVGALGVLETPTDASSAAGASP